MRMTTSECLKRGEDRDSKKGPRVVEKVEEVKRLIKLKRKGKIKEI